MSTSLILHEMWYNYPNKEFYTNVIGKWRLNVGIAIGSLIVNQRLNLQGATLHLQAVLTDLVSVHVSCYCL